MATRSPKGSYWDLGGGQYFVPKIDQGGGQYSYDQYNRPNWGVANTGEVIGTDDMGMPIYRPVVGDAGNFVPKPTPQQDYVYRQNGGAWNAIGQGGNPFTYTGILPGFGGDQSQTVQGTVYTSQPNEQWVQETPDEPWYTGYMSGAGTWAPFLGLGGLSAITGGAAGAGGAGSFAMDVPGYATNLSTGAVSGGGLSGGSMWDWLDELLNQTGEAGVDPATLESSAGGGSGLGNGVIPGTEWPSQNLWSNGATGIPGQGTISIDGGLPESLANFYGNSLGLSPSQIDLLKTGGQAAKTLFQQLGGDSVFNRLTGGSRGGILDQITNDPLGSAFNATPFLLALQQANSQAKDLDGVLNQINGQGYTQAVLNPYDQQTGLGRTALTDSLTQRGVYGSSFGDQSLNNYDYMRSLGRGDLASKALATSAGLQGSLINQRNTNTNLLLGAGLNASGRLFSPQRDPFNLSALLGG